jgi:apolipoprotein N-acyltransferase
MRALESGRAMLRATNDGVTALIDHDGSVTASLPQFRAAVLRGVAQPRSGLTPYVRFGNVPVLVLLALGFGVAAAARRRPGVATP